MNMYYPPTPNANTITQPQPQFIQPQTIPQTSYAQHQDPNSLIRMPYITPPPQPQTYQVLPGRMINNPDDVKPNEVPNDGSFGIFPMADNSAVYLKGWTSNGTIQTLKFVQAVETTTAQQPQNMIDLSEEISQIKETLIGIQNQLQRPPKKHYYDSRQSKGGNE